MLVECEEEGAGRLMCPGVCVADANNPQENTLVQASWTYDLDPAIKVCASSVD